MLRTYLANMSGISVLVALAAIPNSAEAAKVKVWHHFNQGHYDKAQFKHAVVSSEGALRLSRHVRTLANLRSVNVWDLLEDKAGNLFVATGDEGKVFKVAPDGKVTVAYTSTDSQILSLALGADGTVFAGTGPSGLIVGIAPDGATRVFAEDLDSYVWSLVYDPDSKNLFAGTGPRGRIFRITPEGKTSVFYTTRQEHILCLAMGAKGTLYAGTDKGGLVYRLDNRGKGFVLFQANQPEVRSLLVTADGVYAGTSAPVGKRSVGSSTTKAAASTEEKSNTTPPKKTQVTAAEPETGVRATPASSSSSTTEGNKVVPASAPTPPGSGENSLYRIAADGTVRELFRDKTMVLSLLRQNGRVLVGTGMQGQLFEIDEATKERTEIARLDHGQIHSLLQRRDGSVVLGTGDPGKLYVLEDRFAPKGSVTSDVLDAKMVSKWGTLTWQASTPVGTKVTVAVRSGNVAEPDDTWSDWSAEITDPATARILAPSARFLQYRVTMSTENPRVSPEFRSVALRYQTANQSPEVTSFEVPDLNAVNLDNPKKLKLKWNAVDSNEDELTYSLYLRKEGWKGWVMLEDDLEKKEFEWDTTTAPSGVYRLKVVASDRRDNSPEDSLSAERISPPVTVSHTPPTVSVRVVGIEGDQAVVEATAVDPLVRLTEASFAVNGKRWSNVFPTDGLFDSKTEAFRFKTETLRPGTYVLVLRVRDAAGNIGSGDVVFTVQERTTAR